MLLLSDAEPAVDGPDALRPEADLGWRDGVPVSRRFDDPYYSLDGGLAEARHVVLDATGMVARFRPGFRVLETGFGTGLNFLVALRAWREAGVPGRLGWTSFEAFPMTPEDRARALAPFPEAAAEARDLAAGNLPDADLEVVLGDARATLPAWEGMADAVVLDGFAPARNPEMWEPALLAVATRMAPGARLATYTAAGAVRRALAEAGLSVERRPGFGGKRHMTVAWRP